MIPAPPPEAADTTRPAPNLEPPAQAGILVVDDEPYMCELIQRIIAENTPYHTRAVTRAQDLPAALDAQSWDLVLLDLRLPGVEGLELLEYIRRHHPDTEVVMVTAYGTIPTAVEAMRLGAAGFLTKPFAKEQLLVTLRQVLGWLALKRENSALKRALARRYHLEGLIGSGPHMRRVVAQARKLAGEAVPVLIRGEFGTGRSFLARAIHHAGPRAAGPFLELACSTLPPEEAAAALLGGPGRPGMLARAHRGSLLLSEVWSLPRSAQRALAEFLALGRFTPVGDEHQMSSDVRLLATCEEDPGLLPGPAHIDPELAGQLTRFVLELPPLRARREDIPLLASHFLETYRRLYGKAVERLSDAALKWLLAQDWPGNLRELENTLERAVLMAAGPVLELEDLHPLEGVESMSLAVDPSLLELPHGQALEAAGRQLARAFEERYLRHHLARCGGDLQAAAAAVGLTPAELVHRLGELGLAAHPPQPA